MVAPESKCNDFYKVNEEKVSSATLSHKVNKVLLLLMLILVLSLFMLHFYVLQ